RAQDLGQPAAAAAAKVIELEETILSQGIAEAKEQVLVVGGVNVRDAPAVSVDPHGLPHGRATGAPGAGDTRANLLLPPGLQLVARAARRRAHAGDRFPGSQSFQDLVRWKSHGSEPWLRPQNSGNTRPSLREKERPLPSFRCRSSGIPRA